jgi:hypothetical protein
MLTETVTAKSKKKTPKQPARPEPDKEKYTEKELELLNATRAVLESLERRVQNGEILSRP